ncbi:DUF1659 domain-containing protein [Lederbergia wuyishanensis]|uniref:DUF1659 domain-containing protein n=1 Tax=Lederbergia wuyishanensis TaxID=1347903 RepID=A0ABU0DAI8_9BACI|nr:DUF1659 domain-containing protein [Lederbergia wuyishanensis]MCJ8010101.1 DUF1659 domain-containing protein [Lederbergia wuyishanensis]MDQ0345340.1 hypothetical protein [Lederbergia wuyishanensis]
MAQGILKSSSLKVVFDYGVDEHNKPIFKTKTFNRIRRNSTADELYSAATAIGSLSKEPIWAIERNDSYEIGE